MLNGSLSRAFFMGFTCYGALGCSIEHGRRSWALPGVSAPIGSNTVPPGCTSRMGDGMSHQSEASTFKREIE